MAGTDGTKKPKGSDEEAIRENRLTSRLLLCLPALGEDKIAGVETQAIGKSNREASKTVTAQVKALYPRRIGIA